MSFHDIILDELLNYREKNPDFFFLMRQRDNNDRFSERFWFQGTDKYAFVGLIDVSGHPQPTRSVGLVARPKGEFFDFTLNFAFSGETDQRLINCYTKAIQEIGGFDKTSERRFTKNIGLLPKDDFSILEDFLDKYYPILIEKFKAEGREDVLITEEKFSELLDKITQLRKDSEDKSHNLNRQELDKLFKQYVTYCQRSQWLTYREAYKFRFARWLSERVNFNTQTDSEILALCKNSQEQQYEKESTNKGVNFILSSLRFQDNYLVDKDIAVMRRLNEGNELEDKDLSESPLSFPKFSVWIATMLPNKFNVYSSSELNTSISHLFDLEGVSTHGAEGFYLAQSLLSEIKYYLQAHFEDDLNELVEILFPDDKEVRECDVVWLVQDFTLYMNRMKLNRETSYYWVNQGSSYKKEREAGIIAAPNGSLHHHKRLKDLVEGDKLIHYSDGAIQATSTVSKEFRVGSRPYEFKEYGEGDTLIVEVDYEDLSKPIELRKIQDTLSGKENLLPKKYSPLNKKLEINQSYCLEFTQEAFEQLFNSDQKVTTKQYWLYSPGENAYKWDEFYEEGIMAIGWDEIGDLKQYKSRDEIREALIQSYGGESDKRNDVSANDDFLNKMEIGDIVISKRGRGELLGYGIVTSDYFYDESRNDFRSARKVNWKKKGIWEVDFSLVLKTLTDVTHYDSEHPKHDKYYQRLMSIMGEGKNENSNLITRDNPPASNIIFYGPPGTGKTYHLRQKYFDRYTTKETSLTKEKHFDYVVENASWWECIAIALLDLQRASASEILNHPWMVKKVQFSQAKNIRASLWGNLQAHTVEDCPNVKYKARQAPHLFYKHEDSTWEILEDLAQEVAPEIYDLKKSVEEFNPNPDKEFRRYRFVTFHQSFSYEDFIEGIKPVFPQEGEETTELSYAVEDGVFKDLCRRAEADSDNRYAIFIDEINRGNIAQIFGELITLIEVDKRWGEDNQVSAILPYSKKEFRVPNNLDIYGTMNTADRSVEALDTALRRRFAFVEMMPRPELLDQQIEGIVLEDLLRLLNNRIEQLVDRDHTIGHSYFIRVKSSADLADVFNNKVVPLLQEYFYGDFGKIGLVLGEGFVRRKENKNVEFAKFFYPEQDEFKNETHLLIYQTAESIIPSLRQTMGLEMSAERDSID